MLLADEQYTDNTGYSLGASASTATGNTLWPLGDHLGSIRDVVDNNGVNRQHVVFDSFGRRLSETDYNIAGTQIADNDSSAIDELFGDADTQLQYNRARWYNASTGRWSGQDPIGFAASDANLYRYGGNSNTNRTDPSGLDWEWQWEWHHLLPTEVFGQMRIFGVDINAAEYGFMLRGIDHHGADVGVHALAGMINGKIGLKRKRTII